MANPIFTKPNVLVTGAAGFIGSHLCDELIKTNKVIGLDNFISGNEANIDHLLDNPDFEFIRHDINEPIDLSTLPALKRFKIDFQGIQEVYHFACPSSPKDFEAQSVETLKANGRGTINALEIAKNFKAKFLFSSSSVVYGQRREDNPYFSEEEIGLVNFLSPRACYDEGKRFGETACATYSSQYKFPVRIARIFRTYGPRMPLNQGHMVPDFMLSAIDGNNLVIYGDSSFQTSLVYVNDVVDGLVRMMAHEDDFLVLNLGSDQEHMLTQVAQKVIELAGSSSNVVFEKPLLFMTPLGLPDIRKAKEKIGWFPLISLEEGLKKTYDYARAQKGLLGL